MLTGKCYLWGKNRLLQCEHNCKELTQNWGEGTVTREDFLMKIVSKLILDVEWESGKEGEGTAITKAQKEIREMQVFQRPQWKKVSKGLEIAMSDYWQG